MSTTTYTVLTNQVDDSVGAGEIKELSTSIEGFGKTEFFTVYNGIKNRIPPSNLTLNTDYPFLLSELKETMSIPTTPTVDALEELDTWIIKENVSINLNLIAGTSPTYDYSHSKYFSRSFELFRDSDSEMMKSFTIIGALYNASSILSQDVVELTNEIDQLEHNRRGATAQLSSLSKRVPGFQAVPTQFYSLMNENGEFARTNSRFDTFKFSVYNADGTPIVKLLDESKQDFPDELIKDIVIEENPDDSRNTATHIVSIVFDSNVLLTSAKRRIAFVSVDNPSRKQTSKHADDIVFESRDIVSFQFVPRKLKFEDDDEFEDTNTV